MDFTPQGIYFQRVFLNLNISVIRLFCKSVRFQQMTLLNYNFEERLKNLRYRFVLFAYSRCFMFTL